MNIYLFTFIIDLETKKQGTIRKENPAASKWPSALGEVRVDLTETCGASAQEKILFCRLWYFSLTKRKKVSL